MSAPLRPTGCSHSVGRGRYSSPCANAAKVFVDGRGYCSIHDPAKVTARRDQWNAKYEAEREADKARGEVASALCNRLGFGRPHWNAYAKPNYGQTEGVVLTREEVEALLKRLGL